MPPSSSYSLLLLAGLCCLLPGSQTKDYQEAGASGDGKTQEQPQCQNFASTITNISLSLLQKVIRWPGQTNIMFSPVSITAAFAMLSLGAKGSTQKQILNGLRFGAADMPKMRVHKCFQHLLQTFRQPNYQLLMTTGNSLFIDKRLQVTDKFREVATELYNSETIPVNFRNIKEAKAQINKHTMKRSYGHILQVVEDLPMDTALALVNFISLDGIHNGELQADLVNNYEFRLDTGQAVSVPMVKRTGKFYLKKDSNLSSWVLIQHYAGNAMAFFILPDLGKMQQLIDNLSYEYLNSIQRHINPRCVTFTVGTGRAGLQRPREGKVEAGHLGSICRRFCPLTFFLVVHWAPKNQQVRECSPSVSPGPADWGVGLRYANLGFPKFTISATYDLKTVMRTLGITQIFSNKADLSKVTKDAPVKLSKVLSLDDFKHGYQTFSGGRLFLFSQDTDGNVKPK
ncbi:alpha-1-antitrypsin-like protein CM55-MM [Arvicola amphibius]|uniref:alpha-1-antitrypsin-like protein CM55-MM n=1 Tax=Arvicola amphibius TaxID=1047088 RepID=UPI001C097817|nr:alpha-1-antitrypsin-like protein CM55-MM [Arvicola amphibius]